MNFAKNARPKNRTLANAYAPCSVKNSVMTVLPIATITLFIMADTNDGLDRATS